MKRLASLLLLATLCYLPTLHAGEWIVGAKTGPMLFDAAGVDDPTNVAAMAGYQVGVVLGDIGVEGEITTSMKQGDLNGRDVDLTGQGLFATFRSAGPLYFKAKGGLYRNEITVGSVSDTETSEAYGVGLGIGLAVTQIELEYTVLNRDDDDVAFLSVGIQF